MTQNLFDKVIECANQISKKFTGTGALGNVYRTDLITDKEFTSLRYRRAHISVIDARETKKLYLLHVTVFPHTHDPSPIYGFDAVCGANKITGAFHDFSISGDPRSPMYLWFKAQVNGLEWNKPRELPEWARMIFSPAMVAAGNLQDPAEIDQLCDTAKETLDFYLKTVGIDQQDVADFHMAQNKYCYWQKQNPHVVRSMVSMGIDEAKMKQFVDKVLFPEIG